MRSIALDVHRDFCEVAVKEGGEVRSRGRIKTSPPELELFARSLAPSDQVALEATGAAEGIAAILEPHVARVVIANTRKLRAIAESKGRPTESTPARSASCSPPASGQTRRQADTDVALPTCATGCRYATLRLRRVVGLAR
jgi:hypothetical protein